MSLYQMAYINLVESQLFACQTSAKELVAFASFCHEIFYAQSFYHTFRKKLFTVLFCY